MPPKYIAMKNMVPKAIPPKHVMKKIVLNMQLKKKVAFKLVKVSVPTQGDKLSMAMA